MFSQKSILRCQLNLLNITIRYRHRTHYDVLKLSNDCTFRDVKTAFINLSKTCHPDKSENKDSHENYVRIVEAYTILSKPRSRHEYDIGLNNNNINYRNVRASGKAYYSTPSSRAYESSFYGNRDKSQDYYYSQQSYYGINGTSRVSNKVIAAICMLFLMGGAFVQYHVIRSLYMVHRKNLDRTSTINGELLSRARKSAEVNGNEEQINRLMIRLNVKKP